jgi:hypothetical protein
MSNPGSRYDVEKVHEPVDDLESISTVEPDFLHTWTKRLLTLGVESRGRFS